jgi:hypothetical protein
VGRKCKEVENELIGLAGRKDAQAKRRIVELEGQKSENEGALQNTLDAYAKTTCGPICEGLLHNLPRELRDAVYEYIIIPDYIYVGPQYLTSSGMPCDGYRDAYFWNPDYVGEGMRIELVQTWYRMSMFYFWNRAKNNEVIPRFMTFDRWGLGLKPHELISRVRFDVGDGVYYSGSSAGEVASSYVPRDYPVAFTAPFKTLAQFHFPNRVQFLIRIQTLGSLQYGRFRDDQFTEMLDEIVNDLEKLRADEHRFRVEWPELGNLEFASNDEELSTQSWSYKIQQVSDGDDYRYAANRYRLWWIWAARSSTRPKVSERGDFPHPSSPNCQQL